jgi:transporter family protein
VGIWIAFFTAGVGFFLGWILWLSGLRLAEASLLTPIRGGAMTIFAFATSVVLLGERPTPRAFLGAALASAGVVLVSLGA